MDSPALKFIIFILLIAAVILLLFFLDFFQPLKDIFYQIFAPFLKFFHFLGVKTYNFFKIFLILKDLIKENTALREANRQLQLENIGLKEERRENEDLKKIIGLPPQIRESKYVIADIVGLSPENLNQGFLIDKGKSDGLELNAAVVSLDGFLVGRLSEADEHFAKVLLITDPTSEVSALIQNQERLRGVIKGAYALNLILDLLPLDGIIETGQVVITSNLDKIFPRDLPIGTVEKIIFSENAIFRKAVIRPFNDFRSLERVLIIQSAYDK